VLRCWDGEKCLEILHEEIRQLDIEDLRVLGSEAWEIFNSKPDYKTPFELRVLNYRDKLGVRYPLRLLS
jgi:hypothetical protein